MKAEDDFTMKRQYKIGLIIFLTSECNRHKDDILAINDSIRQLEDEIKITAKEKALIKEMSERYRTF